MRNQENRNQRAWLGVAFVTFGAYLLFRNLDLIPQFIPHYLFGWEMIFLVIGGSMIVTGRREGLIFFFIGGFFLLPEFFYWPQFNLRTWWPAILIAVGVSIILRRRDHVKRAPGDLTDDYIEDTSIFGGSEKSFSSQNFKGGKITSVFGGSEINFSGAKMHGDEIILDIFCLFGGNGLIVPNDWTVINESFVIFGGFADKRPKVSYESGAPKKVLRIKGSVIFGGAEVKGV